MKSHLLVASLCVACSAGTVFSMQQVEPKKEKAPQASRVLDAYLAFTLDNSLCIREYKTKNMEFLVPPSEFMGKKFTDAVPLSDKDKKALAHGFMQAIEKDEKRRVSYTTHDIQFSAAVKYLKDKDQYCVTVTQVAKTE